MFYPLGKNSEKPYGGWHPHPSLPPPPVRPRVNLFENKVLLFRPLLNCCSSDQLILSSLHSVLFLLTFIITLIINIWLFVKQSCPHYAFTLKAKRGSFVTMIWQTSQQFYCRPSRHSVHYHFLMKSAPKLRWVAINQYLLNAISATERSCALPISNV